MRTIRRLLIPVAAVWLLALAPAISAEDFEQDNAEYDIITEDGELRQKSPGGLILDTCAKTWQARVCYVEERVEFLVKDEEKDGYSAVGFLVG